MDNLTQFDGNLLIGIQHTLNADWLTPVMKLFTFLGEAGILWIFLIVMMLLFRRSRRLGIICCLSLLATFVVCNLIMKPLFDRPRPFEMFEAVVQMMPDPGDASFPSGHSANSIAVAWAMFIATLPVKTAGGRSYEYVPCLGWKGEGSDPAAMHRQSILFVAIAVLIGLSRLYLGMHYPTDVLCGFLLGMICATVVYTVIIVMEKKRGRLLGSTE